MDQTINPIGLIVTVASLSLIPLIAVTATSFLKISAVLIILRNAIGIQQVPSNMVMYGIAMVLSLLIMGSVLKDAGNRFAPNGQMPVTGVEVLESINAAVPPFKQFMLQHTNPDYLQSFLKPRSASSKNTTQHRSRKTTSSWCCQPLWPRNCRKPFESGFTCTCPS